MASIECEVTNRRSVEQEVLDLVERLVAELGSRPELGRVVLADSLDRDLGLGSLERVELLSRLEHAFGVALDDQVLAEAATPGDLVNAVLAARPPRRPWQEVAVTLAAALPAPATARSLVDVLRWQAERDADGVHVVLPDDDGERRITYGALLDESLGVAGALCDHGVREGESIALMLPTGEAFFRAFFGVLLAGAVPVPLYPPFRPDRIEEYATRQLGILRNADARLLVTFREARRVARALGAGVRSLRGVIDVEQLRGAPPRPGARLENSTAPALLQYTSGSTGAPKGVLLSHANILANIRALGEALGPRAGDVFVSWLPLYHDMGLIGAWLGSLYHGIPVVILSPFVFLARPVRWLQAVHRWRGTISAAPNFAFDLCAKKIDDADLEGLDLSAWRLALNGSEAVSAETIERFQRRFARCGFRAEAMPPVYGLAEASVGLTCPPPGRGPRVDRVERDTFEQSRRAEPAGGAMADALRFVSCGRPLPGHDVRVVGHAGRPVDGRVEGGIEFRGPSVTSGYFGNPAATRAAMRDGWMDSGDLGYWADGELYVTGRRKDIIIKAGRNLYPETIEEAVGDVPGVRKGCVAAFGVVDPTIGTERLVIVAESRATARDAIGRVQADVRDQRACGDGDPADGAAQRPLAVLDASPERDLLRGGQELRLADLAQVPPDGILRRRRRGPLFFLFRGRGGKLHHLVERLHPRPPPERPLDLGRLEFPLRLDRRVSGVGDARHARPRAVSQGQRQSHAGERQETPGHRPEPPVQLVVLPAHHARRAGRRSLGGVALPGRFGPLRVGSAGFLAGLIASGRLAGFRPAGFFGARAFFAGARAATGTAASPADGAAARGAGTISSFSAGISSCRRRAVMVSTLLPRHVA